MDKIDEVDPRDWYWFIGDDETQVWSSKRVQYVSAGDQEYSAWAETHYTVRAASEASLVKYLNMSYPEGAPTRIFAPSQIIAALKAIDPAKTSAVLSGADAMTVIEFQTATGIRMDDARPLAALSAVGITSEELQAAILGGSQ